MTLGRRESGTARLEEAVAAYRAALEERTRERVPLDWATTQYNLGNALQELGERESGTARLEEAVLAYQAALQERTRERVPYPWALTMANLALTYEALFEKSSDPVWLDRGQVAARDALAVYQEAGAEYDIGTSQDLIARLESKRAALP
jgi:tetratricopeptide (TPR) repeat protein